MYIDTAIFVKLLITEPDSVFYAEQLQGRTDLWSSELIITECWSALCRKEKGREITPRVRQEAWLVFEAYLAHGSLKLQPVTTAILRHANLVIGMSREFTSVKTLDAIHLATCQFCEAQPLLTNDGIMRKAADVLGIPLGPLAPAFRR